MRTLFVCFFLPADLIFSYARCADFMKENGYRLFYMMAEWMQNGCRWQKTKRVVELKEDEYDYVEDFFNEMMTCEERGNCRAGRRH